MINCLYLVLCLDLFSKLILTKGSIKIEDMLGVKIDSWPKENSLEQYLKKILIQVKISNIFPLYQKIEKEQIQIEQDKLPKIN
jgi:methionyl-tRNA synthetase